MYNIRYKQYMMLYFILCNIWYIILLCQTRIWCDTYAKFFDVRSTNCLFCQEYSLFWRFARRRLRETTCQKNVLIIKNHINIKSYEYINHIKIHTFCLTIKFCVQCVNACRQKSKLDVLIWSSLRMVFISDISSGAVASCTILSSSSVCFIVLLF